MPKYQNLLLPQAGDNKDSYLQRVESAAKSMQGHDRALLCVCRAIAKVWKGLEMENPFSMEAMLNPEQPRELLETATILMAKTMQGVVRKLDGLEQQHAARGSIAEEHGKKEGLDAAQLKAVKSFVARGLAKHAKAEVLEELKMVKEMFDAVVAVQTKIDQDAPEQKIVRQLKPLYKEFKEIRSAMIQAK